MNNLKKIITKRVEEHIDIASTHSQILEPDLLKVVIESTKKCINILVISELSNKDIEDYNNNLFRINAACGINLSKLIKTITLE